MGATQRVSHDYLRRSRRLSVSGLASAAARRYGTALHAERPRRWDKLNSLHQEAEGLLGRRADVRTDVLQPGGVPFATMGGELREGIAEGSLIEVAMPAGLPTGQRAVGPAAVLDGRIGGEDSH